MKHLGSVDRLVLSRLDLPSEVKLDASLRNKRIDIGVKHLQCNEENVLDNSMVYGEYLDNTVNQTVFPPPHSASVIALKWMPVEIGPIH